MGLPSNGSFRVDYDSNDNPLYEGWATRKGADPAVAVWKITKYTWVVGTGGNYVMTNQQWADGNELKDNIWNNRTSLTYL